MKATEIKPGIYWVGGIDWNLRNFHGYLTQRGSTYNAYLIVDDKITLIDTVKHYLYDEMIERIKSIVDPSKIDIVVSNHVEMDHSGGLPKLLELAPNAVLYTSPNGEKGLRQHYEKDWNFEVVKSGDSISLGKRELKFVLTPMVHWPDNMVSYLPDEKILFSNDAFGQHIASSERFDDEYSLEIAIEEATKYYGNIVLPYGPQVKRAIEALSDLDVDIIAPSHGLIWRKHVDSILSKYTMWYKNEYLKKAVIVYDTMWGATEKMANALIELFENADFNLKVYSLQDAHISDIMTEIVEAEYVCVGSPTLNNQMLPTVGSFLTYLKGLAPKGRKGIAFGAYGWSGQSIPYVKDELEKAGFEIKGVYKAKYVFDKQDMDEQLAELKKEL